MDPAPLLIVGAGGFARETVELVRAINRIAPRWQLLGFLDDDPRLHGLDVGGVKVLGSSGAARDYPEAMVTVCVASPGNPAGRLAAVSRLGLPVEQYATLVHPKASVPDSAVIGPGSVLHAAVVLTADVDLGSHVAVMPGVVLTHDDRVGDGVTFGAGACVAGGVTIERSTYVGSGALLSEHIVVGSESVIGMGAVVTKSVPPREVWMGVPARRYRSTSAVAELPNS